MSACPEPAKEHAMSPLRLGTLITACAVTVLVVFAIIGGETLGENLLPEGILRIFISVGIVSWTAHIAAFCQERLTAAITGHVDRRIEELRESITDYGDTRAQQGLALGLRGPRPNGRPVSLVD